MANPFKRDADYETPPSKRAARLSANLTKGAPKRQPDQVRPRLDKAHDRQEAGIDEGVENNLPRPAAPVVVKRISATAPEPERLRIATFNINGVNTRSCEPDGLVEG